MSLSFFSKMVASAFISGKQQVEVKDNKSISSESSSNLNELSCRNRKANVVTELDDKKLCKVNCNNVNSHNAGEPHKVSVEFVREWKRRKESSVTRATERGPKSTKTGNVLTSIIVINSNSSESNEELVETRSKKRKASANAEISEKRQRVFQPEHGTSSSFRDLHTSKSDFERKYKQLGLIGKGGFGSVYAGLRLVDSLSVAIKYADSRKVQSELKVGCIPLEVVLMQKAGGGPESVGKFAAVTLLDWYCLDQKLVLVMERPPISLDLAQYINSRGGRLQEDQARDLMTQLVDAAMEMFNKGVFHRDLKLENILVEIRSLGPRLRIIDFGCGSYQQKKFSRYFRGTLPYAPPEWFKYKKYKPIPTTVWQLGAMLYCMLHGCPFDTRIFTMGWIKFSSKLSQECLNFLHLCLEEESKKRATLEQLHAHVWLNGSNPVPQGSTMLLFPQSPVTASSFPLQRLRRRTQCQM